MPRARSPGMHTGQQETQGDEGRHLHASLTRPPYLFLGTHAPALYTRIRACTMCHRLKGHRLSSLFWGFSAGPLSLRSPYAGSSQGALSPLSPQSSPPPLCSASSIFQCLLPGCFSATPSSHFLVLCFPRKDQCYR